MESLPQAHPPRQGPLTPFLTTQRPPRRTEVVARETLFGATGNEGLAGQVWDLTRGNDPRSWEMALAVLEEMRQVVAITHTEFIQRTERESA